MIQIDESENIGVITLGNDKSNPINPKMVEELDQTVTEFEKNKEIRGLVLTGKGEKFFSNGFDLPYFYHQPRDHFEQFFRSFDELSLKLYAFPKPTIAAINGHAIAGGCILALCCDYRFMARSNILMGLNEIKLGVWAPYPSDRILHQIIGSHRAQQILESGNFYTPDQLITLGMIDLICSEELILPEAVEKARELGSNPLEAFSEIKANRTEDLISNVRVKLQDKQQKFFDCWFSESVQNKIALAMKKF